MDNRITIHETGDVYVPEKVSMRPFEIADLFGVYIQTINSNIRAVIKSECLSLDYEGNIFIDNKIAIPERFGLEMVTALAFRINSLQAARFRKWIIGRAMAKPRRTPFYIGIPDNSLPN